MIIDVQDLSQSIRSGKALLRTGQGYIVVSTMVQQSDSEYHL